MEEELFLWEQISSSIDKLELDEVQRVVGVSLVSECENIYAEVRALREIHNEYSAGTDELMRSCAGLPRATSSAPAGLVQLELKSLVAQLRKRAADTGMPEEALLPTPASPHRRALESVLRDEGDTAIAAPERTQAGRPGTAESHRLSLREMRLGSSRPSTAATSSQDSATMYGSSSRPLTGSGASSSRPATGGVSRSPRAGRGLSSAAGSRSTAEMRPASAASSVGSVGSMGSASGFDGTVAGGGGCDGGDGGGGPSSRASSRASSRSGLVVSRLRAALDEERQALLGQAEALRLAIDDEHDYRGRVAQPPPSLTSLLELKKSLQDVLGRSAAASALSVDAAGLAATARGRGELSAFSAPLAGVPRSSGSSVAVASSRCSPRNH